MKAIWKEQETEHYVFHYKQGSLAEKEIQEVIELQESCFKEITDRLEFVPQKKIIYWLCDNRKELMHASGFEYETNGVTFLDRVNPTIYAVYNEEVRCIGCHEDVHAIVAEYACPNSIAVIEGLAMYFDKEWWGIPNELCTRVYLEDKMYQRLRYMIRDDEVFYQVEDRISYPIMGAFTAFLIEEYGMEKYKKVYKECNEWGKAFQHIYGKSLHDLEIEFREMIMSRDYSAEQLESARKELYAD
ncbi:MAG: hypothetical protein IJ326_08255 [Lachnospiraceae bacterium]|nr:hypothetical protein [Lachnospiraceae bacterium]